MSTGENKRQTRLATMPSTERTSALYLAILLLGASLEFIVMLPTFQNIAAMIVVQQQAQLWLWATDLTTVLLWFIVPTVWCSAASLVAFRDRKRIVSPIDLQIFAFVAWVFVIIGVMVSSSLTRRYPPQQFYFIYSPASQWTFVGFILSWLVTFVGVLIISGCQLLAVWWFVGLELPETLDRVTYSIPRPFDVVRAAIDETFLDSQQSRIIRDDLRLPLLVLVRPSVGRGSFGQDRYVIMAIGPNQDDKKNKTTVLATVSFEREFYELHRSRYATAMRDAMVGELERRVNEHRAFLTVDTDNTVSEVAYTTALEPTYSKVRRTRLAFIDVPNSFRAMILVTIFFMLAIFVFYYTDFENFGFSAFMETFAVALFALMIEMGIALRTEVSERWRRRLGYK